MNDSPTPAARPGELTPDVRNALTYSDGSKHFFYDTVGNGVFSVAEGHWPDPVAGVEAYAADPRFVKLDRVPRDVQRQWMEEATAQVAALLPEDVARQLTIGTTIAPNEARFQVLRLLEPESDAARGWTDAFDARLREYLSKLAIRVKLPPEKLFYAKHLGTIPEPPGAAPRPRRY